VFEKSIAIKNYYHGYFLGGNPYFSLHIV